MALLSGVLNSLTRFAVAAFAPALLNLALIVALLILARSGGAATVRAMAIAVLVGGILQFAPVLGGGAPAPGIRLHFGRPRLTPAVRELMVLILPATLGGRRLSDQPVLLHLLLARGSARAR